jgi:hypothetical protein
MNHLFSIVSIWFLVDFCLSSVNGFVVSPTSKNGFNSRQRSSATFEADYALALKSAAVPIEDSKTASASNVETLSLFSPCKVNLFLRIIRKREDGYHELASLFQAIGFGDTLELSLLSAEDDDPAAMTDGFTCNMPGVPIDSSNLVLRALELMRRKTGVNKFFQANLIKQVPAQAGLGGGSANAATAMWAANELMGNPASLNDVSVAT